jgi:hypothetical protein
MAGKPGTAARRVIRCRAAVVRRIEAPLAADGVAGTAVRRATPCRAATVHPIKVRSAVRRADGTATEPSGRRLGADAVYCAGVLPRKFRLRCSSGGRPAGSVADKAHDARADRPAATFGKYQAAWFSLPQEQSSPNASFDVSNCHPGSGGVHRPGVDKLALSAAWRQWGWLSLPPI